MCCFSPPVNRVESTKIFARMRAPGRQVLVYQMSVQADSAVAMILPIPVPPRSSDDAVRFISLERYPELFDHLHQAFPVMRSMPAGGPISGGPPRPLAVHSVGAFVASFVPTQRDFDRLDPRFRIPRGTLDGVSEYSDWGFAVFQLDVKPNAITKVHPMAFELATRDPERIFFPTVHVHDGQLHDKARFSHELYAQGITADGWRTISSIRTVDESRAEGLVDCAGTLSRLALHGEHPNRDVWVS
ncbi:MAG: hypothetical protein AB7P03_13900 [Kofleriaceae bacterium]